MFEIPLLYILMKHKVSIEVAKYFSVLVCMQLKDEISFIYNFVFELIFLTLFNKFTMM